MSAAGNRAEIVRAHFRRQAASCAQLGSPFTAALLEGLAERMRPLGRIETRLLSWPGDPGDDALALRAAGALHALAREGRDAGVSAAWPPGAEGDPVAAALAAFERHADWLDPWLDGPPQTNETGRSGALLGGLLALAERTGGMPVDLLEIGASAGLNQNLDGFRYDFGEERGWGEADSPVRVRHAWRGAASVLDARLGGRRGRGSPPMSGPTRPSVWPGPRPPWRWPWRVRGRSRRRMRPAGSRRGWPLRRPRAWRAS